MQIFNISFINFNSRINFGTHKDNNPYTSDYIFKKAASLGGIPCAYCSSPMISRRRKDGIISCLSLARGQNIVDITSMYEPNMSAVEKEVFEEMKSYLKTHPKSTIKDFFQKTKNEHLNKLINKQRTILNELIVENRNNPPELKNTLQKFFIQTIFDIENPSPAKIYSNSKFTFEMINIIKNYDTVENQQKLIDIAKKMPTSITSAHAFIIKYSREDVRQTIMRFLQNSLMSIEHIRPKSHNGENKIDNYLYICTKCNNERGNQPLSEFVQRKPSVSECLGIYFKELKNQFQDNLAQVNGYINRVKQTLIQESKGMIKL